MALRGRGRSGVWLAVDRAGSDREIQRWPSCSVTTTAWPSPRSLQQQPSRFAQVRAAARGATCAARRESPAGQCSVPHGEPAPPPHAPLHSARPRPWVNASAKRTGVRFHGTLRTTLPGIAGFLRRSARARRSHADQRSTAPPCGYVRATLQIRHRRQTTTQASVR